MKPFSSLPRVLFGLLLAGNVPLSQQAAAQMLPGAIREARHYNTVSVQLNAMNYFGDLAPKPAFTSLRIGASRPNLGLSFSHRVAPRVSARASLSYGRITADDQKAADQDNVDGQYRYHRNLRFRNDIVELAVVGTVDLFENPGSYLDRPEITPYLFMGLAGFYHNPKAPDASGNYVALQPLGTEGQQSGKAEYDKPYKRLQMAIPFGLGATYRLNRNLNLAYEIGWRKTFTDYLDDVSGSYAAPADLSGKAAEMADRSTSETKQNSIFKYSYGIKGNKRGTTNEKDWYIISGFRLDYILIPGIRSPKFR